MVPAAEPRRRADQATPTPEHAWLWELVRLMLGAAVVVALAVLVREHFGALQALLDRLGPWAPLVFVALHAVAVPLFFPVSVLGVTAGVSFGFWRGTALLFVAGLISATIMFALARGVLSGRVRAHAERRPRLARFLDLAEDDATRLMVLLRLSPLNFALVSYLLGAGRVRFLPYLLTSALVLPSSALQAYVGRTARVVGGQALRGETPRPLEVAAAVVAVIAMVILTVMLGRLARRALEERPPVGEDGKSA